MVSPTNQSINRTGETPTHPIVISDDPQVIRAQIERTRAEMGQTLDVIQMRLSPDYIKQQTQDSIREATVEKVEKMAQTAEYKVNNWRTNAVNTVKEYVTETAEQAQARAEHARVEAQHGAEEARIQARRQVRHVKRSFWHTMEENPLAIGAAAVAAGALIGLALPNTEKENELMGETRDRLVQDAPSTVQETVQKVQTVAETTAKTAVVEAKQEAEKQNLPTPDTTGKAVK